MEAKHKLHPARDKMSYLFLFVCFVLATANAEKKQLYVGALLELSNHWYQNYVNFFVDIIEYVFEEVDNRTDILPEYSLKLVTKDTQGNNGLALKRLLELMTEGPQIIAVLGPTLSYELTVVGQITPFYNILQLSYIAMTSTTLIREHFPTLFLVNQIMDDLNPLRIKMMTHFGWNKVGTIFFQNDIYVSHMNKFHDLLKENNMTLLTSAVGSLYNSDISVLVSRLQQYEARVIMGTFSDTEAGTVFCEAYKRGLYGRHFVWILSGSLVTPGFDSNGIDDSGITGSGCTLEQIKEASKGLFTLTYDMLDAQNTVTINNKTSAQVSAIIKDKVAETPYKLSSYYGWVYDAAWSLAVGLNNSLHYLDESGLHNYSNNPYYLDAILKGMYDVNFKGITAHFVIFIGSMTETAGPVSFNELGQRVGVTYIEYNSNFTRTRVAMYVQHTDDLIWFVDPSSLWPDGAVPRDTFTYKTHMVAPNIVSLVLVICTNSVCILTAVVFLAFNIYYRKNSNIKLSSPMINNIIIAGSIVMFIVVFLTAFDYGHLLSNSFTEQVCMIRVWIMSLGFTSLFGALFSKTWRVHILFRDHKLKKKTIKDFHLFGIVVFLLILDSIILLVWSLTHRLHKDSFTIEIKDPIDQNNIIKEVYTYCYNEYEGYWFVSMYIYKGLLLAFGTFLAWETRHVVVPALNDSKYIGFCIYNVVIVCIFGVPLTHVLPSEQTTLNFVLVSALVMFCTTLCLCILFIPKLKIRSQVGGLFLNPSLNNRSTSKPVTTSCSGQKEKSNSVSDLKVAGINTSIPKGFDSLNQQDLGNIKNEIDRRLMKIDNGSVAVESLKNFRLEQSTGTSAEESRGHM